jgi:hypothetical protein
LEIIGLLASEALGRPSHLCFHDAFEPSLTTAEEPGASLRMTTLEFVIGNVISIFPLYLVETTMPRISRSRKQVSQLVTWRSSVKL